jgi:hypothetical protein
MGMGPEPEVFAALIEPKSALAYKFRKSRVDDAAVRFNRNAQRLLMKSLCATVASITSYIYLQVFTYDSDSKAIMLDNWAPSGDASTKTCEWRPDY